MTVTGFTVVGGGCSSSSIAVALFSRTHTQVGLSIVRLVSRRRQTSKRRRERRFVLMLFVSVPVWVIKCFNISSHKKCLCFPPSLSLSLSLSLFSRQQMQRRRMQGARGKTTACLAQKKAARMLQQEETIGAGGDSG